MNISQWSDLPLVLTSDQAAVVLQLKRRTITNMLDRGDLHGVKIGKEWRVSRAELLRFVEGGAPPKGQEAASPKSDIIPTVIDKGGVLVAQVRPLAGLADFVRRKRDQRVADLIQQAGL
jgi:excisionase family DNA binding protein